MQVRNITQEEYGASQLSKAREGDFPCEGCPDENNDGDHCVNDDRCVAWEVFQKLT